MREVVLAGIFFFALTFCQLSWPGIFEVVFLRFLEQSQGDDVFLWRDWLIQGLLRYLRT